MDNRACGLTRGSWWVALAGVVLLVTAVLPAPLASASAGALDLEGSTNVEYAIAWSQQAFPDDDIEAGQGPDAVLLGRDDLFADNLASGALQGDRPLLLTASNELSARTAGELERLGPANVTILGGENAVSPSVAEDLAALGYTVDRLAGTTRIETAVEIAGRNGGDTAILARAFPANDPTQAFADSLAAGGWAAEQGWDVLLTQTEVLTGSTANHIETAGYNRIIIVGGTSAISQAVADAVAAMVPTVERLAGATRFETAVQIANARGFASPAAADVTIVVDGQSPEAWADGFSAAHLSASGSPIVLSNAAAQGLPQPTRDFLAADQSNGMSLTGHLDEVDLICGSSVPDGDSEDEPDQCAEAAALMGLTVVTVPLLGDFAVSVEPVNVAPGDEVTITIGGLAEGDELVISGCGVEELTVTVAAEDIDDGNVVSKRTISTDQPPGDCDVSISVNGQEIGPIGIEVIHQQDLVWVDGSGLVSSVNLAGSSPTPVASSVTRSDITGIDAIAHTNKVVYTTDSSEGEDASLVVHDLLTDETTILHSTTSADAFRMPAVSPDGSQVAVVRDGDVRAVLVVPIDGQGDPVEVATGAADYVLSDGAWNPSSTRVAYNATGVVQSGRTDTFQVDADGGGEATFIAEGTDRVTWRTNDQLTVRSDADAQGDALVTFTDTGDFVSIQGVTDPEPYPPFGTPLSMDGGDFLTASEPVSIGSATHDVHLFRLGTRGAVATLTGVAGDFPTGVPWEIGGTRVAFPDVDGESILVHDTAGGEFQSVATIAVDSEVVDLRWF